jgi:riboflavin kinase / FMN adenylyltransferase
MRLCERIEAFQKPSKAIVSMGTFDGVHLGHQQLLQRVLKNSREVGGEAVVVTFWPHPRLVLAHTHQASTQLLTTFDEKVAILAHLDIDHLLKLPFTKTLSQLSAQAFFQQVLVAQVGVAHLVIGHDHRFGKDRLGNIALLQEAGLRYNFTVEEVPPTLIDGVTISSTKIRQLLLAGNVEKAQTYLGRPYEIHCTLLQQDPGSGQHTPNIYMAAKNPHKLIPPDGHYTVQVAHRYTTEEGSLHIVRKNNVPNMVLSIPHCSSETLHAPSLRIRFKKNLSR